LLILIAHGNWLQSKLPELAQIVNERLDNNILQYQVHIQDIGWTDWQDAGTVAGTIGECKRLEAIKIQGEDGVEIQYRAHVENQGWQEWKNAGEVAGTTGQSLRMEALEIKCNKPLEVQEHLEKVGWMPSSIGYDIVIGTVSKSLRMEAIKINLL
jgi:uncharacterized protein YjdB